MTDSLITEQRNGLAVWSLTLGIVAIVLSIVVVGGALGLVAVVLGIIAISRPAKRGSAVGGIVTGALAMVIAAVVVLVAVIVAPAFSRARAAAGDTRALSHLRQLDLAMVMYSNDNKGYLPPGVAYAGPYVNGMASVLQDPRVHPRPLSLPSGSWVSNSAEVEAHFDFVYTGAGVKLAQLPNPSTFIIVYDKPAAGHWRVIAFADGHAERLRQDSPQLARDVEGTNQTRSTLNMPPLPDDLSGPP